MRLETHQIELGRVQRVNARIDFPAGEFELRGGAGKLLEGDYRFDSHALRPVLDYKESGGAGELRVQADKKLNEGSARARWETRLNDDVPLDLELHIGAGKAEAMVGTLNLRRLQVHFGAGELTLDLRGKPRGSYDVEVNGGVGLGRIYLPGSVGVEAEVHGGIGGVDVQGELRHEGSRYYNVLWGKTDKQVRVRLHGGVGTIKLIAEN